MIDIGARGAGEHDVRTVIVGEDERPLDGAGRQHDLLGADLPQYLARDMKRRLNQMVGDTLDDGDEIMIVIADCRRTPDEHYLLHLSQLGESGGEPVLRRNVVKSGALATERAAKLGHLVDEENARPGLSGSEGGGKAGRAATDDEDIAMRVTLLVVIGVGSIGGAPHPGGAADEMLIELPRALRPHESLVVEASGQQRRHQRGSSADIEAEGGKAILTLRREPVIELDHRRPRIGLGTRPVAQPDQRIWLLRPRAQDAARPMVLETPTDQAHAIGEERRGEAVAGEALIAAAIEGEVERSIAIDEPADWQAKRLTGHSALFRAGAVAVISCVTVSRRTVSQARQPA